MKNNMQVRKDYENGQRRLWCDGISIRLLTKDAIEKMSDHGFAAYGKKFSALRAIAGLSEDWYWHKAKDMPRLTGADEDAHKAFDFLRHTIVREKSRREDIERGNNESR